MDDDVADRFIDLEVKLAYQERTIRELDGLVRELATKLEQTEQKLAQLEETLRSGEVPLGPANEPPPHY